MRGDTPNVEATHIECPTAFSAEKAKKLTPKTKSAIPSVKSKLSHNPIKRTEATTAKTKINLRSLHKAFYLPRQVVNQTLFLKVPLHFLAFLMRS
jgi:hypothetical protein